MEQPSSLPAAGIMKTLRPAPVASARIALRPQPASWLKELQDRLAVGAVCTCLCLSAGGALAMQNTPYTDAKTITYGVVNGRIQTCPTNLNPNCVSTSSTNDAYAPAWRADASSGKNALQDIESVMLGTQAGATKLIEADTPFGWYSAYSVSGKFNKPDVVEFLVKEDGVTDRGWEGDKAGPLVLYRSVAGEVKYIWPITQPISDMGTQKKRMQAVRKELGWPLVGCELVECYDELESKQQFKLF